MGWPRPEPDRDRTVVEAELVDAIRRRQHAADELRLDEYQHLAEHVDALLEELHTLLPAQRRPSD